MALKRLPEEIWEKILERLDDSRDITAILNAYPELDGRVMKNKFAWLIDQTIPHLRPWLNNDELLLCRLVCQRWCRAVDNHLEHHPSRRPYDEPGKVNITGQVDFPEGSRAHQHYKLGEEFGTVRFSCWNGGFLHQFLKYKHHPKWRNPFVGRSLELDDEPREDDDGNFIEGGASAFWKGGLKLLRKFGQHVWFLSIQYFDNMSDPLHFCRFILDVLPLVPNLRRLRIEKSYPKMESAAIDEYLEEEGFLPSLPDLDTLEFIWPGSPQKLFEILVMGYSNQIRKLTIRECYWRPEYADLFLELAELDLYVSRKWEVGGILPILVAPQLKKLTLRIQSDRDPISGNDVFAWIMRLSNIRSFRLEMVSGDFGSEDLLHPLTPPMSSRLQSCVIRKGGVGETYWNFFHCLPSLEYLRIEGDDEEAEKKSFRNQFESVGLREMPKLREVNFKPFSS